MDSIATWAYKGLCADMEPDMWFIPDQTDRSVWNRSEEKKIAVATCFACPVNDECYAYSIQFHNIWGVWAGLDEIDRREIQNTLHLKTKSIMLSTNEGRSRSEVA